MGSPIFAGLLFLLQMATLMWKENRGFWAGKNDCLCVWAPEIIRFSPRENLM